MDKTPRHTIQEAIEAVDKLIKHFSLQNDERHYAPHNWDIGQGHDELDDPNTEDGEQKPHGQRTGVRRRATALTALKRRRGKPGIPKFEELVNMTTEQLDTIGRKHFGSKWEEALAETAGGTSNNLDVKDVPDSALDTEADGPVDSEIVNMRERLKDMARKRTPRGLNVKDINEMSDAQIRQLAARLLG